MRVPVSYGAMWRGFNDCLRSYHAVSSSFYANIGRSRGTLVSTIRVALDPTSLAASQRDHRSRLGYPKISPVQAKCARRSAWSRHVFIIATFARSLAFDSRTVRDSRQARGMRPYFGALWACQPLARPGLAPFHREVDDLSRSADSQISRWGNRAPQGHGLASTRMEALLCEFSETFRWSRLEHTSKDNVSRHPLPV